MSFLDAYSNASGLSLMTITSSQSLLPSQEGGNGEEHPTQEFMFLNDSPDVSTKIKLENNIELPRHEVGYPVAQPKLCKIIKSSVQAIALSGGCPVQRRGFAYLSNHLKKRKAKKKFVFLTNGKLRFYSLLSKQGLDQYIDGEVFSPDNLKKESTYGVQRIHAIRYSSVDSKSFTLVFKKPRKGQPGMSQGLLSTVNRIRSMSQMTFGSIGGRSSVSRRETGSVFSTNGRKSVSKRPQTGSMRNGRTSVSRREIGSVQGLRNMTENVLLGRKSSKKGQMSQNAGQRSTRGGSFMSLNLSGNKPKANQGDEQSQNNVQKRLSGNSAATKKAKKLGKADAGSKSNMSFLKMGFKSSRPKQKVKGKGSVQRSHTAGAFDRSPMSSMTMDTHRAADEENRNSTQMSSGTDKSNESTAGESPAKFTRLHSNPDMAMNQRNRNDTNSQMGSKKNVLLLLDDLGNIVDTDYEYITFTFKKLHRCHDWLKHILVEIENQAILFSAYCDIIEQKQGSNMDNLEVMLRKAVDLYTLARGVRNTKVWQMRERLANLLDERNDIEEAKVWFELSYHLRSQENLVNDADDKSQRKKTREAVGDSESTKNSVGTFRSEKQRQGSFHSLTSFSPSSLANRLRPSMKPMNKPKTRDEAFTNLVYFLEEHGRGLTIARAKDEAQHYFDNYELVEIARHLEAEYGRVPEGYGNYILESAPAALDVMREKSLSLKSVPSTRQASPTF